MEKDTVTMIRGDERAEVTPDDSVRIMQEQGWQLEEGQAKKPSDGLKVAELKDALTAKGIAIPEGAKKEDLAKLLDDAA